MSVKIDEIQLQVIINGEKGKYNLKELTQASKQLRAELSQLPVGTQKFLDKAEELKKVNTQIGGINKELRGMHDAWGQVKKMVEGFSLGAILYEVAAGIKEFGKESIHAYSEAATAEAQLLNALHGQKDVQEELIQQAKEIQKHTLFQDDAIVAAQTYLAAQELTEDQIKKTIAAAVQLATVTGVDLDTATKQLAGTYEGVTGKLGKLDSRIKGFSKTELENGSVIDLVNDKYKGFAETAAETGSGPLTQFYNTLNDIQEVLGSVIVPLINGIATGFKAMLELLIPLKDSISGFFKAIGLNIDSMEYFKTTIAVILLPLSLFVKSITLLFDGLTKLVPVVVALGATFKTFFTELGTLASDTLGGIGDMLSGVFTGNFDKIKQGWNEVKKSFLDFNVDLGKTFAATYAEKTRDIVEAQKAQADSTKDVNAATIEYSNTIADLKKHLEALSTLHEGQTIGTDEFKKTAQEMKAVQDLIDQAMERSNNKASSLEKQRLKEQKEAFYEQAQLHVDGIADEGERARAQLALDFTKELDEYGIHYEDIDNLTEEQQAKLSALHEKFAVANAKNEKKYRIDRIDSAKKEKDEVLQIRQLQSKGIEKIIEDENQRLTALENAKVNLYEATRDAVTSVFDTIAGKQKEGTKRAHDFAVAHKGISAATATIDGLLAIQQALSDPTEPSTLVKTLTAVAIGITTAANVFKILAVDIPGYKTGVITDGPQIAQIGEDGPEAVIPLSGKYRDQAMPLFETAAAALGFKFAPQASVNNYYGQAGGGMIDPAMMKVVYKLDRTVNRLVEVLDNGVTASLDFNRYERDLKRIDAVRKDAGVN